MPKTFEIRTDDGEIMGMVIGDHLKLAFPDETCEPWAFVMDENDKIIATFQPPYGDRIVEISFPETRVPVGV